MAQTAAINIYGANGSYFGANQTMGFPTQNIVVRSAPANQVMGGVTMLSVVQLLPTGTKVGQDQYSSPSTVAAIVTICNA